MSLVYTPKPTTEIQFAAWTSKTLARIAGEPCELHFNERVITVDESCGIHDVLEEFDRLNSEKGNNRA